MEWQCTADSIADFLSGDVPVIIWGDIDWYGTRHMQEHFVGPRWWPDEGSATMKLKGIAMVRDHRIYEVFSGMKAATPRCSDWSTRTSRDGARHVPGWTTSSGRAPGRSPIC